MKLKGIVKIVFPAAVWLFLSCSLILNTKPGHRDTGTDPAVEPDMQPDDADGAADQDMDQMDTHDNGDEVILDSVDIADSEEEIVEPCTFTGISAGEKHTCAITEAGGVMCWGRNNCGQLGYDTGEACNPETPSELEHYAPQAVEGLASGVFAISCGEPHTCALLNDGHIRCWGHNNVGQLGNGATTAHPNYEYQPVEVLDISDADAISAGSDFTCAIDSIYTYCWGYNNYGQLGYGDTIDKSQPNRVGGFSSDATAITAGASHACAMIAEGCVKCWGLNDYGQLGDGTNTDRTLPVDVSGACDLGDDISAGAYHTCVVQSAGGGVFCWGRNNNGQVGDGTNENRDSPVEVSGLSSGVEAVSAGSFHTCALLTTGSVKCWGRNENGNLGDGTNENSNYPVEVSGLSSPVEAIAAGGDHTCALLDSGRIMCWGDNRWGQLGNNGTGPNSSIPVQVLCP